MSTIQYDFWSLCREQILVSGNLDNRVLIYENQFNPKSHRYNAFVRHLWQNVILGSGPVGKIAALQIGRKNEGQTLVIDAGDLQPTLSNLIDVKSNINYLSHRGHSLESSSVSGIWYGALQSLNIQEFAELSSEASFNSDISKYRAELNRRLGIRNFDFSRNQLIKQTMFHPHLNLMHEEELNYAKVIKDPTLSRISRIISSCSSIETQLGKIALCLIPNSENIEIITYDKNGAKDSLFSKNVFLALGTLENTRLLLASLPFLSRINCQLLGQNLSDHLSISLGEFKTPNIGKILSILSRQRTCDGHFVWPRFRYVTTENEERFGSFVHASHFSFSRDRYLRYRTLKRIGKENLFLLPKESGTLRLGLFLEKDNDPENRVSILHEPNNSIPKMQIEFNVREEELERITNRIDWHIRRLGNLGLIDVPDSFSINRNTFPANQVKTAIHPSGTYRMSSDPESGVVDSFSRLWSDKRIRVLGAGAFPRSFSIHPTYASMLLAMRSC